MNQSVINNLAAKINSKEQKSNKVASWNSTPSDDKYPSEKLVKDSLDGKANSSHNHTVNNITDFPTSMTPTNHTHGNLQNDGQIGSTVQSNKNVVTDNTGKITTENKPTIPTSTSDLINDGEDGNNPFIDDSDSRLSDSRTPLSHSHGYITNDGKLNIQNDSTDFLFNTPIVAHTNIFSNTSDIVKGYFSSDYVKLFDDLTNLNVDGGTTLSSTLSTIDTAIGNKANINDIPNINGKENVSNKVTSLSSSSTDTQYPSAKAVYDALAEITANSGGNYIYDFYLDSSTEDIVLEYDSASGGSSESVMGSAYYHYKLELSNHFPKTGDTITVTCKVTDVFNNPIPQKSVELFLNETSQGTEMTDVYGVATWSITFGATRSALLRVENAYAYVNYNSWKLVETKESNKVRVYVNENMVALSVQDSFTLTANGNRTIATISSQYAPNYTVTTNYHPTLHQTKTSINADGQIIVYNNSTATSGSARIYVTYPLKARMP